MRCTALVAVLLASGALQARAADIMDFVVADDDGYGIADCMRPGQACGQVIADAWCEAHGHAHATAFGPAEDVTGAIKVSAQPALPAYPAGAVVIHCGL